MNYINMFQEFMDENSEILSHLYLGAKAFIIQGDERTPITILSAVITTDNVRPILTLDVISYNAMMLTDLPTKIEGIKDKHLEIGETKDGNSFRRVVFSEEEAVNMCIENCKAILKEYETESRYRMHRLETLTERLKELKHE